MTYYDDVTFAVLIKRFSMYSSSVTFRVECNSIEYIQRGKVKLEANGKVIDLIAPVLFWMKRGGQYRFFMDEAENSPYDHVYCDMRGDRTDRMIEELERVCPEGYITPQNPELVESIFADMIKKYRQDKEYYHPELVMGTEQLVLHIVQSARQNTVRQQEDPYGIIAIGEKIKSDPFQQYDFKSLAEKAGISYEHYRHLFREIHQSPPAAFVQNRKMFLAAEMLQMTNMRIKEIMTTCQFDSMMNFSRTFKRYSGLSPMAYRKRSNKIIRHIYDNVGNNLLQK